MAPSGELEAAFGAAAHFAAEAIARPSPRAVLPRITGEAFDRCVPASPPAGGDTLSAVGASLQSLLSTHTASLLRPGFLAMISASPNPYSILADALGAAVNQHVARGDVAEFAARLEQRMLSWIGEFLAYPAGGGILTSGGSMALLTAFVGARKATGIRPAQDVRAYTSSHAHFSVARALSIMGFERESLATIDVDDQFRMRPESLLEAMTRDIADGRRPWLVVAQGGSVSVGAVDPLDAIADLCADRGAWLHVDAAYGGPAAATDAGRGLFSGLARADSMSVDPHKWLSTTYDCGCVLTRAPGVLDDAFSPAGASYVTSDAQTDAPDFMGRGPELSRSFRALKIWATFTGLGAEALRLAITQDMALAATMADEITRHDRFELAAPVALSIVAFRFNPIGPGAEDDYLNALNSRIPGELRERGEIYLGALQLAGRTVLRACLINHRTVDADIAQWIALIDEAGQRLHKERHGWWNTTVAHD